MRILSAVLVASFFSLSAFAAVMSPEEYLNKISERLTGAWATPAEFQALASEQAKRSCYRIDCMEDYFQTYVRGKLNTTEFYNEATLKVFEKFGFQTTPTLPLPLSESSMNFRNYEGRELTLPYRVFRNDFSIDQLFTSDTYWERKKDGNLGAFASMFGLQIETEKEPVSTKIEKSSFPELGTMDLYEFNYTGHPNVAGLFSTSKFLSRYWNSPINANRKRAAAFYRIMLCFSMNPALEREKMAEREEALAKGIPQLEGGNRTLEEIHKNRHANQADCAKCHNLLDPVAHTMRPLELGISKFAASGVLRMNNGLNGFDQYKASSFAELVKKATRLPNYEDCQVNWLFNWIIGKDVQVHPQRFMDLLTTFNDNGRKAKTMVEKLVLSPEFRGETAKFVEAESYKKAMAVFQNCRDCHTSFFNTSSGNMKLKLRKIVSKLDLSNDGLNRSMPPANHWWQPTVNEIQTIRAWVASGAPLTEGRPILNAGEIQNFLQPRAR